MNERIRLGDGKYEFYLDDRGTLRCLRYGEVWRDFVGDKAVWSLFQHALELEERLKTSNDEITSKVRSMMNAIPESR